MLSNSPEYLPLNKKDYGMGSTIEKLNKTEVSPRSQDRIDERIMNQLKHSQADV